MRKIINVCQKYFSANAAISNRSGRSLWLGVTDLVLVTLMEGDGQRSGLDLWLRYDLLVCVCVCVCGGWRGESNSLQRDIGRGRERWMDTQRPSSLCY